MNKKIFIALLLCAVSMCTWADVTYNFGNGSTWTVKCSGQSLNNVTGVVINVATAGDLAALRSNRLIYDAYGNDDGWPWNNKPEKQYSIQHVIQKDVVVSGTLNEADMNCIYAGGDRQWTFCTANTLDLSGVSTSVSFDNIASGWKKFADCHGNSETAGLVIPGSGNTGGSSAIYQLPNNGNAAKHITLSKSFKTNDVCDIHACGKNCNHSLSWILEHANITSDVRFDLVKINLDNDLHDVTGGLSEINTFTLDLTGVANINDWEEIENQYVSNVLIRKYDEIQEEGNGFTKSGLKRNFDIDKLYNFIVVEFCDPCDETHIYAYVNKPGFLATGLQYVPSFNPTFNQWNPQWYNKNIENHDGKGYQFDAHTLTMLKLAGYVFARDLKATDDANVDADGHLIPCKEYSYQNAPWKYRAGQCSCTLAPSKKDPTVHYCEGHQGYADKGLTGASGDNNYVLITHLDLTDAQFGYVDKNGVFQYYPADMTLSELQYFDSFRSIAHLSLPTSHTQYIIPEAFLKDSKFVRTLCIPYNYKEIHRYAFLGKSIVDLVSNGQVYGKAGGISHFTTTAADDDEIKCLRRGDLINYGDSTLALPSTTTFVGRGAFAGYDGAALINDVYVLAPKAPICETFTFDQKTYVGDNFHHVGHLIRKGNYVGANMAMLHFPNTTDRLEMLNYSDMTRKYRLYDETGHYDNMGNILVWPTQQQYNRSFNQALAGVTWWAWNENIDGTNDPEHAFSAGTVAGGGYANANFEYMFPHAASYENGFSDDFAEACGKKPQNTFDGSESKGPTYNNSLISEWKKVLLDKSIPQDQNDRPLSYNFELYGGWHQFVIAELYDFLLDDPDPDKPKKFFYNFEKYNKNIWYTICFDFNLTKAQLRKAFGDPEHGKDPFLSTLAGVTRDANKLGITIHMSKDLLHNKLVYEEDYPNTVKCDLAHGNYATYEEVEYGEDDIVVEANKPYFILPCLPEKELIQAATGSRRCEYTPVKEEKAMFPVPTHVHAVNANSTKYMNGQDEAVNDTAYAFNYYFVGNYLPNQPMPVNSYYLGLTKKSNGDWWSSFFRMTPDKEKTWGVKSAIVMAMVEDNTSNNHSGSKGHLEVKEKQYTYNYYWNAEPYDDFVFFAGKSNQTYAKTAFGINVEDNYTTSIELPIDYLEDEATKVYNLNGQFVGIDADKMSKGVYIVGGKKVVVK